MFSCFKAQQRERVIPNGRFEEIRIEPKSKLEFRQENGRIFDNKPPILKNQYLDPRDQRIYIPINIHRCISITTLTEPVMQEVTEWLMRANYLITSRGFRHLADGRLTEIQSKTYTSKNMLLNIKELVGSLTSLKEVQKQELMVKINTIETEILTELMRKYPQSSQRGASKRIRSLIRKIDNRANCQFDFLFKNDIEFNYRADGHYAPQIMKALNKIISFAGEVYQPEKGINQSQDSYYQIWAEVVEYVVINNVRKNQKQFFDGFDFIFTYQKNTDIFPFDLEESEKMRETLEFQRSEKMEEGQKKKLQINHKIPIEANLFTEEQIESGQCKIRNASVLRVIAKWTYELLQKLNQPKQLILHRVQKFKLINKKLYSLENNQKLALYEAANQQRQRVQQYINKLKRQYILLQTIFAEERTKKHIGNEDSDLQIYAIRVREVYSQCLFKLLCKLIQSLKRVPRQAGQIYIDRYQNQLPEDELRLNYQMLRQVDLISFKVGDLIRAKYGCSEVEFLKIYKNLLEISEQRPDILKITRIKNRLDQKQNDIMVNVFFLGKVQCELQLSFDRMDEYDSKKSKIYSSYNHFLYEIKRSLLGPIGQYACILGQYDPVVSQYVVMDKNHIIKDNNLMQELDKANLTKKISGKELMIDRISENSIPMPSNFHQENSKSLREIHQILFLCLLCGQFKKPPNFSLSPHLRTNHLIDDTDLQVQSQPIIRQCKECFLKKLQQFFAQNKTNYLLNLIFGQRKPENQLYYKHLFCWDKKKKIPLNFRNQELQQYLPREGFMLSKQSRIINFQYFRMFADDDFTYFATKANNSCIILSKISKILSQDQILQELASISKKYFIFTFDKNVTIEDGAFLGFGKQGQFDVGICKLQCCKQPSILGQGIQFKEFNESINKMFIKRILQQLKNVMYLSKRYIENMINEVVMDDKKYDRNCKAINTIEAEDSHLKDIRFTSKMVNLSDVYIRYNSSLTSLNGIESCKNLKILFCNECKISSIQELRGLIMLEELFINENEIETLEGLENCINLKELYCYWNQINTLEPIRGCKSLLKLDIGHNNIRSLQPLSSLGQLKSLATSKNDLTNLEGIQTLLSLEIIDFSHTLISDPTLLNRCSKLQRIFCSNTQLQSLSSIEAPNLIELDFGQCANITEFDLNKRSCNTLEQLTADKCVKLKRLKNIEFCLNLRQFLVQQNPNLEPEQFALISKCHNLQQLNLNGNPTLSSLYFLQKLPKLNNLTCSKCERLSNQHFNSIKKCQNIEMLNLSYNRSLTTTQFLKGSAKIYHMNLSGTGIARFEKTLSKLQQMRYLELKDLRELQIINFQFLREAVQMEKIVIEQILDIQSLKGVEKMSKLKELHIGKLIKVDPQRLERLEKEIKNFPIKIQRSIRFSYDVL